MPEMPASPRSSLRELKKRRTRQALAEAALDLFLAHGYEATTVDDIVAAVDVSQRTFFRYFAGKEDVALSLLAEYDGRFLTALAARPAAEPPVAALTAAMRMTLDAVDTGDPAEAAMFRKVRRLIDTTPTLAVGEMRRLGATERRITAVIAGRMGVDPMADPRPRLIAATFLAVVRVGFEGWAAAEEPDPAQIAPRMRETFTRAAETLPGAWSVGM